MLNTPRQTAPRTRRLLGHMAEFSADRLGFLTTCARDHGDFVPLRFGHKRLWFVSEPAAVGEFLITRGASFRKNVSMRRARALFGNGLLMSEGAEHDRNRRLIGPRLKAQVVAGYDARMRDVSERVFAGWHDKSSVDLLYEFSRLAIAMVAQTLFATDILDRAAAIVSALAGTVDGLDRRLFQAFPLPLILPTRDNRRIRTALRILDGTVESIIEQRRLAVGADGDLLSQLLATPAMELSEQALRDEVTTLLLAGHETTANCLTFTCWLLATHRSALESFARR